MLLFTRISFVSFPMFAVLFVGSHLAGADDIVSVARSTSTASSAAVVTLRCTIKLTFSGPTGQKQDQEHKIETTAICVDPTGVFIANYTELNPTERIQMMFNAQNRQMHVEASSKNISLLFQDGSEKPADIVISNKDLDAVFIRLKTKAQGLKAIDLVNAAEPAHALDQVFVLGRGLPSDKRTPTLAIGRILCSIPASSPYYLVDKDLSGYIGCVIFSADGKPLGIETFKSSSSVAADVQGLVQDTAPPMMIRPVDQLSPLVQQALTASVQAEPAKGPSVIPLVPITP